MYTHTYNCIQINIHMCIYTCTSLAYMDTYIFTHANHVNLYNIYMYIYVGHPHMYGSINPGA